MHADCYSLDTLRCPYLLCTFAIISWNLGCHPIYSSILLRVNQDYTAWADSDTDRESSTKCSVWLSKGTMTSAFRCVSFYCFKSCVDCKVKVRISSPISIARLVWHFQTKKSSSIFYFRFLVSSSSKESDIMALDELRVLSGMLKDESSLSSLIEKSSDDESWFCLIWGLALYPCIQI